MQYTQEENILIQTYFTTSFLFELKNNNFLQSDYYQKMSFEDKFVKDYLPSIGIDNQGALLMSLYSMLVIPKELLFDNFPNEFLSLNTLIDSIKDNSSSTYKSDVSSIDYIRHIRNAVAHGKIKFNNNFVTFEDERVLNLNKSNQKTETFHVTFALNVIGQFLTELQNIFMLYIKSLQQKYK